MYLKIFSLQNFERRAKSIKPTRFIKRLQKPYQLLVSKLVK